MIMAIFEFHISDHGVAQPVSPPPLSSHGRTLPLECRWKSLHVVLQIPLIPQELHIRAIDSNLAFIPLAHILLPPERCKPPILTHDDLLPAGKLVLAAAQCLERGGAVRVAGTDGKDDLPDVYTCNGAVGLAEGATHAGLQAIGPRAGQHFVYADNVVGVGADAQVEPFLAGDFDQVSAGKR